MAMLKVKDNQKLNNEQLSTIPNLVRKVADKTLGQLEHEGIFVYPESASETDDLSRTDMIIQSINNKFQFKNIMGFIGCGDERLVIESRFSGVDNDHFFRYLLEKVLDCPNLFDLPTDVNYTDQYFDYLIFLFPHYLHSAMRKGLFKKYIIRKYNDKNIKGNFHYRPSYR